MAYLSLFYCNIDFCKDVLRSLFFTAPYFLSCYLLLLSAFAAHQHDHNGLLGVQPVLGLVEDHAVRALHDLGRDLLAPVGGEAVHHDAGG